MTNTTQKNTATSSSFAKTTTVVVPVGCSVTPKGAIVNESGELRCSVDDYDFDANRQKKH